MTQNSERSSKQQEGSPIVVNASRVGNKGGLLTFSIALLKCLANLEAVVETVLPEGVDVPFGIKATRVSRWLASSSRISRLRPIIWLIYSAFFFPVIRGRRILSTTHHTLPFRRHQIITVHDLRPYHEPDSWVQAFYFRHMLPRNLLRCDGILTVSETSKRAIISSYRIPEKKIHVVRNAITLPPVDLALTRNTAIQSPPFLLMVGASWKHKNAMELLENQSLWTNRYLLKIVAGRGQYSEQLRCRARDLNIGPKVEIIESIHDAGLAELYSTCSALVYPSRLEGFGLPPLEAMAQGVPVLVSDIPVHRELLREVPLFVRLGDPASWAEAFCELREIEGDPTHWRRSAGRELASSYSLARMQASLSKALKDIWGI